MNKFMVVKSNELSETVKAATVSVKEGHLLFHDDKFELICAYAPECWCRFFQEKA